MSVSGAYLASEDILFGSPYAGGDGDCASALPCSVLSAWWLIADNKSVALLSSPVVCV